MKILFAASLLMLCISTTAQKKTIKVSEDKIGSLTCNKYQVIDMLAKDTTTDIYISFKNAKYSYITDIAGIFFFITDIYDIKDFIDDLKLAEKEMDTKQSIEWKRDKYTIYLYDFNPGKLYIEEPKRNGGYTTINKKQVGKLVEWMEKNAIQ